MHVSWLHLKKYVGLYESIAFLSGFVLMAFELVAARLLAPSIGSSIYIWTNVIGVMIAALALGYAVGGFIADIRNRKQDIIWLLLLAAVSIILVALLHQMVLRTVIDVIADGRAQGLVASILLFALPSFLMGTISPYLARLKLHSLKATGRSIAGLSAANSLGGIAGTFCTGFLFFSIIGSVETLALLAALLALSSWLLTPSYHPIFRVGCCGALTLSFVAVVNIPVSAHSIAEIDTPSAHYKIMDVALQNRPVRVLTMGPAGWQSGVYTDGSKDLVFDYTRKIADLVAAIPNKNRVLILGGGAFSLPEYLGTHYPASIIDVSEIDPKLPFIAKQYFGYSQPKNVRVFSEDGRTFIQKTTDHYDVIIADVYNDISVPFSLTTQEYTKALKNALNPDGIVIANLIAAANRTCRPLLASLHGSYATAFSASLYYPLHDPGMAIEQNIISVYSNAPLIWATHIPGSAFVALPSAQKLTDNFAPIEVLKQRCTRG